MRLLRYLLVFILASTASASAASYKFYEGHTEVRFYWSHAGLSEQSAEWDSVQGKVEFDPDNIEATTVSVTIEADSISTGFARLDSDLGSERFFDVANNPQITFVSTSVARTAEKSVRVTGDLTIKGITRPLVLDVDLVHYGVNPLIQFSDTFAGDWLGIRATGTLLRSEFGVGFAAPLNSDTIRLEISSELQPE